MSLRTFNIELRFDMDDPEKEAILRELARQAAQQLYANAQLISGQRAPEIALYSSDFFDGPKQLGLIDGEPVTSEE